LERAWRRGIGRSLLTKIATAVNVRSEYLKKRNTGCGRIEKKKTRKKAEAIVPRRIMGGTTKTIVSRHDYQKKLGGGGGTKCYRCTESFQIEWRNRQPRGSEGYQSQITRFKNKGEKERTIKMVNG